MNKAIIIIIQGIYTFSDLLENKVILNKNVLVKGVHKITGVKEGYRWLIDFNILITNDRYE